MKGTANTSGKQRGSNRNATSPGASDMQMAVSMAAAAASKQPAAGGGKQKNVLGLDFEIPDELSQLLAQEMRNQGGGNKSDHQP